MDIGPFWTEVRHVDRTTSTNDDVADAALHGAAEGLVVVAEEQSAGRGRLGRAWTSPRGAGLTFSMLLRPDVPDARWTWLPLLTGVALAEGWSTVTGVDLALKWPNDLLVGDRKVAGILAARHDGAAVIGVGLNVTNDAADLAGLAATSLELAGAHELDRDRLLEAGLRAVAHRYRGWVAADGAPGRLREEYARRCSTLGQPVRVQLPDSIVIEGTAVGVDDDGRLLVATPAGRRPVSSGDVIHVRAR